MKRKVVTGITTMVISAILLTGCVARLDENAIGDLKESLKQEVNETSAGSELQEDEDDTETDDGK